MKPAFTKGLVVALLLLSVAVAGAETVAPTAPASTLDTGSLVSSMIRLIGALVLVFAVLFGGVWLFRRWQGLLQQRGGNSPKLRVLEVKSLGSRHALYVVGYEKQRLLLSSSPAGVSLLTTLPEAEHDAMQTDAPAPAFSDVLQKVLNKK